MTSPKGAFLRDVAELSERSFDLVVAGGGIHGVCLALEAARRGRAPLLVEAGDYGRGASARSLRVLHGGFRYLQSLDLPRFRESIRSRRWFLRHFPSLTAPRRFILPLDGKGVMRPAVFRTAFLLDDHLSRDRNDGVAASHHIPPGSVIAPAELESMLPFLGPGHVGAAAWSDGWMAEPQRLLMEILRWAVEEGATAINHVRVTRPEAGPDGRVSGFVLEDEAGRTVRMAAGAGIAAAGAWSSQTLAEWGVEAAVDHLPPTVRAFNVAVEGDLLGQVGLGLRTAAGTNAFLWSDRGYTFIGTVHEPDPSPPDETRVSRERVRELLREVGAAAPGLSLSDRPIVSVTAGRLPARSASDVRMPHRDTLLDLSRSGAAGGLYALFGLKYTTAPEVASKALDQCVRADSRKRASAGPAPGPCIQGARAAEILRLADVAQAWEQDRVGTRRRLAELRCEEGAGHLEDLVLGRFDGTEDATEVRSFASAIVPELWPGEEDSELARLELALSRQVPL